MLLHLASMLLTGEDRGGGNPRRLITPPWPSPIESGGDAARHGHVSPRLGQTACHGDRVGRARRAGAGSRL
jgi:hypothetical protein